MEGEREAVYKLVLELVNPDSREQALMELSKKRDSFPDLAPVLWNSFGTMAALLQEIIAIYPLLSPPQLGAHASNRVCNALALLQCVASHQETRTLLLHGTSPSPSRCLCVRGLGVCAWGEGFLCSCWMEAIADIWAE